MRKLIAIAIASLALAACTKPYVERTTPKNCACNGNWEQPIGNGGIAV